MTKKLLKEIFETVFIEQVKEIIIDPKEDCAIGSNEVIICFDGYIQKWNIYELAHKCKVWVVKNSGWTLQSYTNERGVGVCRVKVGDGQEINKLIAESEVDSIFKATEWVLEELKNKGKLNDKNN